jgi:hypothetical protein
MSTSVLELESLRFLTACLRLGLTALFRRAQRAKGACALLYGISSHLVSLFLSFQVSKNSSLLYTEVRAIYQACRDEFPADFLFHSYINSLIHPFIHYLRRGWHTIPQKGAHNSLTFRPLISSIVYVPHR